MIVGNDNKLIFVKMLINFKIKCHGRNENRFCNL